MQKMGLVIGAIWGGISLLFFPNVISKRSGLRIFLLFFYPYSLDLQPI